MKTGKDKISVKQLFFVFTIIVSSPATRLLPKYAAAKAEQAGWVSPIISTVPFILLILAIDSLLKKHKEQSMRHYYRYSGEIYWKAGTGNIPYVGSLARGYVHPLLYGAAYQLYLSQYQYRRIRNIVIDTHTLHSPFRLQLHCKH